MDKQDHHDAVPSFSARLTPHRSLGPKGFLILMCAVGGFSFAAGLAFWLMGAWPVFFFFGLDVLLVYWAFRANYAAAGAWEQVELAGDRLTIERQLPGRDRKSWEFHPYWVKVELAENNLAENDELPDMCGPLLLRSHGRSVELASFLSPSERRNFADALRTALASHQIQDG